MPTSTGIDRFRFGSYEFEAATGELFQGEDRVKIQPQPARVLGLLLSRPGELVTREELRQALWADGTTVEFDLGLNYCIRQIRAALGESASEPRYLETLPKKGYRFIAAVSTVPADGPPVSAGDVATEETTARWWRSRWLGLAAAMLVTTGLMTFYWRRSVREPVPGTLLVLPLRNLGLPVESEWLGDALTQQLIGALIRTKSVAVRPWSTSASLAGQTMGVKELGRRYQVDAVIEGSVRQTGERVQVNIHLVDTRTERTIWTYSNEQPAGDFSRLEKGILDSIAETLSLKLRVQELPAARVPPEDRETYNLYLKAAAAREDRGSLEASAAAFEEVIRRAPGFAPAYAGLANVWAQEPLTRKGPRKETFERAAEHARQAIELDPSMAEGHAALAHAMFHLRRWDEAEREFEIALQLDPTSSSTLQIFAIYLGIRGRFDEALEKAKMVSSMMPASGLADFTIAQIQFHAGNYDGAIATCRRVVEFDPGYLSCYRVIARSYAMKGMFPEALAANAEFDRTNRLQASWKPYMLARSGALREARTELRNWETAHPGAPPPFPIILGMLEAGEVDRGFQALRTIPPGNPGQNIWMRQTPELRKWHGDPRFTEALAAFEGDERK